MIRSAGNQQDSERKEVSGLNEALSELSIIHVAGTKGKGSTCTFSESILGECGYKTGLFTSPHLIDVRERFKINRENVSEQVFLKHFWWCWDKFKINVGIDMPMPTYFRFLTLLAFKIFIEEKVDVAILEVGLGGRFDATNVVRTPTVCGITSLGFDHMEILGYTLPEIAGEKAGIFKPGIPAFTVAQQKEAMDVLQNKASELDIRLQVVSPLTKVLLNGSQLSMEGEHQLSNGALAVALCHCWAQRREEKKHLDMFDNTKDKVFEADKYMQNTVEAYRKIKLALEKTQSKQKKAVDRHYRELLYSLGDWVLLRFKKARLRKMKGKERLFPKLGVHFYGPFQVCDKINDVTYRLKLPKDWKIHNAFQVSLLRPFVGDVPEDMVPEDQPEVEKLDEILVPEQILAHKDRKVRGKVARRYLVKLKNYSPMGANGWKRLNW
ncbi:hypothetical protein L7F22_016453 [Adiantum nelumboides]|nr:hypothetical protein [Adiantum nelumboides]